MRQLESSIQQEHLEVQIVDSYSAADRNSLAGGEDDPSETSLYQLQWRPTEKHVLILEGGMTVCHVGLVGQAVEVQGNPVSIAGIGGVLTRRGCRGRGYCRIAMGVAEVLALNQMAVSFILLFCRPALQSLYQHLGWIEVSSPVWVEQIQGNVLLPMISMVKPLRGEQWPKGEIRLGSRPW
ncbi:MAG: GNAT family N-acetyltransferase [Candidatus Acidiferrum sp.]